MSETTAEKHVFQAEIQQLLELVVHSLYTDKDIFLRELISNASDSMEKVRHLEGTEKDIKDAGDDLQITLELDKEAKTITLTDRGVGMTHDELVENLGTIAHSGTKAFLEQMKESGSNASGLIGQFGVGFYSAFMVADKVEVFSRSWKAGAENLRWESDGKTGYEIETVDELPRGVKIVLHLNEGSADFAEEFRVKGLIERYSNFVGFPILLDGKRINEVEALWLKNKSEVSDEEYKAFYQFACKGFDEPAYRLHFAADAPITINALIFAPGENPEKMGFGKVDGGVALYCKKVLIDPEPKGLLPEWLRFVKGVVDSADLPLNISRETMQDSALVQKLNSVISKRIIKMFEKEAAADPEKYRAFYKKFERFFKEGIATDYANKDALAKLLRFETSMTEAGEVCSLTDYVGRMKDGQEKIYFLIGQNRDQIESGPYVEAFKARGLEVIYFMDAVDEYIVDSLGEFDGKKLSSVRHAGVDLEDVVADAEALSEEETEKLCEFLKMELGDAVTKVSSGKRLVDSPVIALVPEDGMSPQVRQMMKAMDENFKDEVKVELEINPRHALVRKLSEIRDSNPDVAKLVAAQLLDNALISAGLLDDARETIRRMNSLMEKAMG
ncbi:MAG: molecular chaperone HtpG [Akkermansiaceae bacterium]|jgi:TNF receptor-associated protein 1|nr:molecular chaperone HtpG [Akkermansiaceae bacterium]MDP4647409.1 molecular chaperone HtpG [Akkermansiaceae bacterium]MDP4721228.1 molecular chaperone HtpG [Akkermansiaceae bacterium]MDP4781554.1 molecular chaperone HtpG [Akkermansiaceae bacterium]MDP4848015.1 molecular chaperone HtpG [Akkermansiaceae bacterium]